MWKCFERSCLTSIISLLLAGVEQHACNLVHSGYSIREYYTVFYNRNTFTNKKDQSKNPMMRINHDEGCMNKCNSQVDMAS